MRFSITGAEPSPDVFQAILAILGAHNEAENPEFMAKLAEPGTRCPLVAVARDDAGSLLGGAIGETLLRWFKLEVLAVEASARRRGVGRALLEATEREAVARGCRYAYLETMVYQAPEFYEAACYERVCTLPDWDSAGRAKYVYTKSLT